MAGAALWCGPGIAAHWPAMARALGVPLSIPATGVAITYDDGPHPEGTPAILEELRGHEARVTFFLVAEQVEKYRSVVAEIVEAGHEPAVHGFRHRNQMRLSPRAFTDDLDRAIATIADACGRAPTLYRPPYGIFTLPGLAAVRRRSLEPVLWSKWGRDWRRDRSPDQIASAATRDIAAGDVILLHDADWYSSPGSHRRTAAATPAILEELSRRGLRAVPLAPRNLRPRSDGDLRFD